MIHAQGTPWASLGSLVDPRGVPGTPKNPAGTLGDPPGNPQGPPQGTPGPPRTQRPPRDPPGTIGSIPETPQHPEITPVTCLRHRPYGSPNPYTTNWAYLDLGNDLGPAECAKRLNIYIYKYVCIHNGYVHIHIYIYKDQARASRAH